MKTGMKKKKRSENSKSIRYENYNEEEYRSRGEKNKWHKNRLERGS